MGGLRSASYASSADHAARVSRSEGKLASSGPCPATGLDLPEIKLTLFVRRSKHAKLGRVNSSGCLLTAVITGSTADVINLALAKLFQLLGGEAALVHNHVVKLSFPHSQLAARDEQPASSHLNATCAAMVLHLPSPDVLLAACYKHLRAPGNVDGTCFGSSIVCSLISR